MPPDPETPRSDRDPAVSWGEIGLATAGIVAVAVFQLVAAGRLVGGAPLHYCWTKPFWLDEFHTLLLGNEPSLIGELVKLARGADYNPPGLYLLLRAWSTVVGPLDELKLRAFSSLVTLIAMVGLYRLLRRSFAPLVCFTATVGLWSTNDLFMEHAFSARFYGPWVAVTVWTCSALLLVRANPGRWAFRVLLAVLSALLCIVHYFGILTLGLIVASHLLLDRALEAKRVVVLSTAFGPLALACCAPFYFGQSAALSFPTWLEDPTVSSVLAFLVDPLTGYLLPVCAAGLVAEWTLRRLRPTPSRAPRVARSWAPQAGATAQLLLPAVLAVFSYVVRPAFMRRYAMPAMIGVAPIAAAALSWLRRWLVVAVAVVLVLVGALHARSVYFVRKETVVGSFLARQQDRMTSDAPVVFFSRHLGYPAWRYSSLDPGRIRIALNELEGEKFSERFVEVEKSVTRRLAELFGAPPLLGDDELSGLREFYLVDVRAEEALRRQYPDFQPIPLAGDGPFRLYRMLRR